LTKFRATARAIAQKYSMAYDYPNDLYDPKKDQDEINADNRMNTPRISVVFGPKEKQGEVLEAVIPDKYAKHLLKRTLEKDPFIEVVPTEKK